jgi:hypothetical protein
MRVVALALLLAGCAAQPVSMFTTIPKDTGQECTKICGNIGLSMTAVVVVASQVGCVCEKSGASRAAGASAASGGAVIAIEAAQRQQQQQQHSK